MKAFERSASFEGGIEDLDRLHAWLDQFSGDDTGLDEKALLRIRLALAEAFSNAVLHAHGGKAGLPVGIRVTFSPGPEARVRLDITDSGPGFRLPPPAPASEEAERGRGLIILRAVSERLEYQGNTLTLWLRPG